MKLNILPAQTGLLWVKLGIQTFFKQPLALGGLFFIFIASVSVAALLPFVGNLVGLALVPALTLGLMVATLEALHGKFPMPTVLATAFRAGKQRLHAMLILGLMYAIGFFLVMGITVLVDGGEFAKLYVLGAKPTDKMLEASSFQSAAMLAMVLYIPLSLMFWHAPALLHWHNISPAKAIFFSFVACMRNFKAYTVYGLVWAAVFAGVTAVVVSVFALLGMVKLAGAIIVPLALILASMFFCSIYFTFRDSFVHSEEISNAAVPNPPANPPQ